jgi:dihydrofolate reductase
MRSVTSPCRAEGLSVPKLRVHNFSVSVDGYAAGPDQSLDNPLGVGGEQLHDWAFATKTFRRMFGEEGGDQGVDDRFAAGEEGLGATIMGRNMFGPIRGDWPDDEWKGWWGDDPPYHHQTSSLPSTRASRPRWREAPCSTSSPTVSKWP